MEENVDVVSQRWSRLREVVEHAFGLEEHERADWLERECGDDAELREEAQALIGAALEDEEFLEPNARRAPALADDDRVGPYRLVRLIASGGMGTVYEAEREDPHRRVALKVVRTVLDGPGAAARFRYEVEVLAKLQHPHIASMYESGMHGELPWFAMEYIEDARPLVTHAREKGIGLDDRVRLFVDVCDAVQHGHANGVLHRDLKPENLLVDGAGRCRVIDFGVARATNADIELTTLQTSTGEIIGTLAYMSPEQVAGDSKSLDTRSDVYALGVVLYELLTGELPYEVRGAPPFKAMATIRESAPRKPSTVSPALRGDLDTILLKCLAKDRSQRYGSCAELGQDLRRYLDHEPISAHPPSVAYQVRVFSRRHRVLVTAAMVVVVVSVAAAIVSATYAVRARRSEKLAIEERDRAADMFEVLLQRSMATNDRFVPRLMRLAGASPVVLEMTKTNLEGLQALEDLAENDPRARRAIATAYLRFGAISGDPVAATQLGDRAATIRAYERAVEIARELHEEHPRDDAALRFYADTLASLGYVEAHEGEHEAALEKLELAESFLAEHYRRRPDDLSAARANAMIHWRLSAAAHRRGDKDATRRHAERARTMRVALAERWPEDRGVRFDLALAQGQLAAIRQNAGDLDGALRLFRASIEELEKLSAVDPDDTLYLQNLASNLLNAGVLESNLGHLAAGTEHVQRSLDSYLVLRGKDPENQQLPTSIIMGQYCLAQACERQAKSTRDAGARRRLRVRERDAYHAIVQHYEKKGKTHGGFVDRARERYEKLRAELGDG